MTKSHASSRFGLLITAAALFALIGCDSAKKAQDRIDDANTDYRRMQLIDAELLNNGVVIADASNSVHRIDGLDRGALERVRILLSEFVNRGRSIISTSQRKDVKVLDGQAIGRIEWSVGQADRLRLKVLDTIAGRGRDKCADGRAGSLSAARSAATAYVRGLDARLSASINWDDIRAERLEPECQLVRVTFRTRRNASCRLNLILDRNTVVHDQSDRDVVCR